MSTLKFISCRFTSFAALLLAIIMSIPVPVFAEDGYGDHEPTVVTTTAREKTIYFPQFQPVQSVNNEAYMINQTVGKLALSDECLRVVSGERGFLLIWPGWYTFDIVSRDIVISNLRTGAVVGQLRIGDTVTLTGGELEDRPVGLKYIIPDQCKGPYWAVGDIQSARSEPPPKKAYAAPAPEPEKPQVAPPKKPSYAERERPEKPVKYQKKYVPSAREPKKTVRLPKPAIDLENDPEFEKSMVR